MIGKYRLSQGGVLIAEQENLITTAGKKALLDYVAGYSKQLVGSLAVGVGNTAANVADRRLVLEVDRATVSNSFVDYANSAVVFKATIPQATAMTIYELGAFTLDAQVSPTSSQLITTFDAAFEAWSGGTFLATNSRIDQALQITAPTSSSTTYSLPSIQLDLSGYSAGDTFTFAYRPNNAFVSTLVVRFLTSAGNYYQATMTPLTSGTYIISNVLKSAFTTTGTPDWANITEIQIIPTSTGGGSASVDFDAIRVDDTDAVREDGVLFSRSVLGSPVTKTADLPMDIEYAVQL